MEGVEATDGAERLACRTPDGVELALYDFGGRGPDLLLVHATGFCAEVFTPLARNLGGCFRCWGLDLRAHGRSDRPRDGDFSWSRFAVDVLAAVDHLGLSSPTGFGHSCGATSLLLAEEARPGTFSSLYCFEPVMLPEAEAALFDDNPMSAGARRRRESFAGAQEAFAHFSSKPPFSEFHPEVLGWYVRAGLGPVPSDAGGDGRSVRLRCRREDEAMVYAHAASNGAFGGLDEVQCPVTLACGALTDSFGPSCIESWAEPLPRARTEILPGMGHFGPLQHPVVVAESVVRARA